MAYFKIGSNDYSAYTNALIINTNKVYNADNNAAGDTVVDLLTTKREIEVGIIPLNAEIMKQLLEDIDAFNVSISFLNPKTGALETDVNCIIPTSGVEYYTIQVKKIKYKAFTLKFIEL